MILLAACTRPQPGDGVDLEHQIDVLLSQMTLEQQVAQMHGESPFLQESGWHTADDEALGIPGFKMVDGPRGVNLGNATAFPVGMARGATWDPELERRVGEAIAEEVRANGANVVLAPVLNLLRHPGWGRAQETYGEDSHHMAELGLGFVAGAQEHVLASAKHYAVNSIEDTRFEVDVTVDERTLREIYLPHFRRVVQEGDVASVMSAYNLVNGFYCAENAELLAILKDEWGFDGFVESDWFWGTRSTVGSAKAGLDIEMPAPLFYGEELIAAVDAGEVEVADIEDSARRILRKKLEFELHDLETFGTHTLESNIHRKLAQEVARESIVLLDNDGSLPLDPTANVIVLGELADVPRLGDHGSSKVEPSSAVSPLEGLEARTEGSVLYLDSVDAEPDAVADADAVIVIAALTQADEGEQIPGFPGGDRDELGIHDEDIALIEAAAAVNDTVIVVLEAGSAVVVDPWVDLVQAVVMAWYPGMQGGHAIAEILYGDEPPSGRMPLSVPKKAAHLVEFDHVSDAVTYGYLHGYRQLLADDIAPRYAFGHGLTYTTFGYDGLSVTRNSTDDGFVVRLQVTNEGEVDAREVVQVYVGKDDSAYTRAPRDLRAFTKFGVKSGRTADVELRIPDRDLMVWDGRWILEPGAYRFDVGRSAVDIRLSMTAEP